MATAISTNKLKIASPNLTVKLHKKCWNGRSIVLKKVQETYWSLYCGNGNFSLALAQNFERVLATELAKPSVDSAQL